MGTSAVDVGSDFGIVFCGGGPAALGPFVAAARLGRFEELLARRILIVERGTRLGAGSLRHYRIASNSFGGAFVEGLDAVPEGSPLDPVKQSQAAEALRAHRQQNVPLRQAGAYLDALGDALHAAVEQHPACAVSCSTIVSQVALRADGTVVITLVRDGVDRVIRAERAVIALGGQPPDALAELELLPGMTLTRWSNKVQPVATLLDDRKFLPAPLLDRLQASGHVAIVGGSHSAWSAALVLLRDLRFWTAGARTPRITLLHRSPIRLFYLTSDEAVADGFPFDPVRDVCPLSRRVNRAGGLKGEARDLARRVLRGNRDRELPIELLNLSDPAARPSAVETLDDAAVIFVATGYQATLPVLKDERDQPLRIARRGGGLAIDESSALIADDGRVLSPLQTYGLGVHTPVSPRIGGEMSYGKAITSSWLYQHDLGESVLQSLLNDAGQDAPAQIPILARGALGW